MPSSMQLALVCLIAMLVGLAAQGAPAPRPASRLAIVVGKGASEAERNCAEVLAARLARRSGVQAAVVAEHETPPRADLTVLLGLPANHERLAAALAEGGVALPTERDPGPEGFVLKSVEHSPLVLAAGTDQRGVLYAVGEILRRVTYNDGSVEVPDLDLRTAPAFRWRGSSANQGGTMRQVTGARPWTTDELHEYALDLALSGANVFYGGGEFRSWLKSFDLMTEAGFRPNEWRSDKPFPREWQATERGNWVCPSIPEARKALLAQWERVFREHEGADVMRMFAGDPGGCRCPRCAPWGKTFVSLCADMAQIWLKYHPHSTVQIANQDLDNAGDQAIWDYLNEKPRPWLYAICYGPGSNAMSDYFRSEQRQDLFTYPGTGPLNRYLQEILHNLPLSVKIVHYSDITHWISSQYQVAHPEPHLVAVYGRRTFHVRPQALYRIFQAIMPFAEGDIIYSEGYHDEFHQFMWNRLLWNPHLTLDEVMGEYARLHFGEAAAPDMVEAMLQLEQNLEAPLADNPGIDRYYRLVRSAGDKIPAHLMRDNHRWREYMQKAALDKYLQLKLQGENSRQERALQALADAREGWESDAVARARRILAEPAETPEMGYLRSEAGRLGEESNALYGVRNVGFFRLDKDLVGHAWLNRELERVEAAPASERLAMLGRIVSWEDPGPGGWYDSAEAGRHPHLVRGETYDAREWLDPANRPSQNTLAYVLGEGPAVVFRYTGLDPRATYRVRLTMVAPRFPAGMAPAGQTRLRQHVLADGEYLARDVEVPVYTARQFEYPVPPEVTQDGTLELAVEKVKGGMGAVVSEVWVVREE